MADKGQVLNSNPVLPDPEPLDVTVARLCPFPKASESLSTSSRGPLDPWLLYTRLPVVWLPLALTKLLRLEGVGAETFKAPFQETREPS